MPTIGLTFPLCDVNGCPAVPTITDGDYVQCEHHEKTAYATSTYWRRITRISEPQGTRWPYYVAEYD